MFGVGPPANCLWSLIPGREGDSGGRGTLLPFSRQFFPCPGFTSPSACPGGRGGMSQSPARPGSPCRCSRPRGACHASAASKGCPQGHTAPPPGFSLQVAPSQVRPPCLGGAQAGLDLELGFLFPAPVLPSHPQRHPHCCRKGGLHPPQCLASCWQSWGQGQKQLSSHSPPGLPPRPPPRGAGLEIGQFPIWPRSGSGPRPGEGEEPWGLCVQPGALTQLFRRPCPGHGHSGCGDQIPGAPSPHPVPVWAPG